MSPRLVPPGARELAALTELRLEVRAFLAEQVATGAFVPHVDTWLTRWDRDFTRELGRRGWLGMVLPTAYGGQGRTYLERFVVTEELLVVGAPVAAHWVAERQIGPSLLRYGTEEQKQAFLPGISRGELVRLPGLVLVGSVGHQRIPRPRAMTPRRISLVPPRSVKPGRCRIAARRSVSSSSSRAQPDAVSVST